MFGDFLFSYGSWTACLLFLNQKPPTFLYTTRGRYAIQKISLSYMTNLSCITFTLLIFLHPGAKRT